MVKRVPMQVDDEFKEEINKIIAERTLRGYDKRIESERRLTKGIARLIKKDLNFRETLIISPLENDRRTNGGRRIKRC